MRRLIIMAFATTALAACTGQDAQENTPAAVEYSADGYRAAIADIARPAQDRERDETRKPGELLAFAQVDKGEAVGDYIMGGGYVTRLLAIAVGNKGKVYAFQPTEFIAFRPEYAAEQDAAVDPYDNVVPLRAPIAAPGFPEPLDTIITVQNFHDLFISQMAAGTAASTISGLYAALKPGGTLVVVDHSAPQGTGTMTTDATHRIEKQAAIDALTAAGFTLEAESDLYVQPDDPRNANVFEPSIRGKTDQFSLRLRKPV